MAKKQTHKSQFIKDIKKRLDTTPPLVLPDEMFTGREPFDLQDKLNELASAFDSISANARNLGAAFLLDELWAYERQAAVMLADVWGAHEVLPSAKDIANELACSIEDLVKNRELWLRAIWLFILIRVAKGDCRLIRHDWRDIVKRLKADDAGSIRTMAVLDAQVIQAIAQYCRNSDAIGGMKGYLAKLKAGGSGTAKTDTPQPAGAGGGNTVVEKPPKCDHNTDFTQVDWFGVSYTFSIGNQAKAVAVLWREWEANQFGLHEKTIGERIGSSANDFRLLHIFRGTNGKETHPAWDKMIVRGEGKGTYKLQAPKKKDRK